MQTEGAPVREIVSPSYSEETVERPLRLEVRYFSNEGIVQVSCTTKHGMITTLQELLAILEKE